MEYKVYKFKLEPSAEQERALNNFAGARRFVYNWALNRRRETYKATGKAISWSELSAELTALKHNPEFAWLKEIDSQLLQQALADCKRAFDNFFAGRARFPKFKKRESAMQSFRIPQRVKLENRRVYIPKIGWIKIRQSRDVECRLKSATFKRNAVGEWFFYLVVEFELPSEAKPAVESGTAVGVDVGLSRFAMLSNGETIENPRFFRVAQRKLRRGARGSLQADRIQSAVV
jgi:putative transposase